MHIYKSKTYEYSAPFPGVVPGLPKRLTGEEAEELGVKELLRAALEIGTYREAQESEKDEE
jgi:hypothetical protein